MMFIRLGDKKTLRRKRKRDINIVDELKDLLNEYINIMCVTEDIEQLKSMKKGRFINLAGKTPNL